jgi:hypothetical protein
MDDATPGEERFGPYYPIEEWTAYGLKCRIAPGFINLNGYVQIPTELFNQDVAERVLRASGGITYGPDENGLVGFDTAHAGDWWAPDDLVSYLGPRRMEFANEMREMAYGIPWGRRWTMDRLKEETERLAQQIAVALDLASIDVTKGEET